MARPRQGELAPLEPRWLLIVHRGGSWHVDRTAATVDEVARWAPEHGDYAIVEPVTGEVHAFENVIGKEVFGTVVPGIIGLHNAGGRRNRSAWTVVKDHKKGRGHYVLCDLQGEEVYGWERLA